MTNSDKITKKDLISIDELPVPTRSVKYPYEQWEEEIPPGQAIEITSIVPEGKKAGSVASTIMMAVRRKKMKIKTLTRNNRLWIYKEKEESDTIE